MENMVKPAAHPSVARVQALRNLHGKRAKNSCTLCSAVAYCCGAVAPRAIAALLGRFLPRLGPLVHSSGPFFLELSFFVLSFLELSWGRLARSCRRDDGDHSAADANGSSPSSGSVASTSARTVKSL